MGFIKPPPYASLAYFTAKLTATISATNPVYDFSAKEVKTEKKKYTPEELETLRGMGWLCDDFETFMVILAFLDDNGVFDNASDEYIAEVFRNAKNSASVSSTTTNTSKT